MAAGVTDKLWEMDDLVGMLEQWDLANQRPVYNFVVRKYDIGKGYSVSVLWRGGEVDTIYGFETERWSGLRRNRKRGCWKLRHDFNIDIAFWNRFTEDDNSKTIVKFLDFIMCYWLVSPNNQSSNSYRLIE